MNRALLIAILCALVWCGVEMRRLRQEEPRLDPAPRGTTIYYYVPDGTCINVSHPDQGDSRVTR
jgi:hypothetical protein